MTAERLKEDAHSRQMSVADFVDLLYSFYDMKELELFLLRLKDLHRQGYTPIQLAYLSVLYTYLAWLDEKVGLTGL